MPAKLMPGTGTCSLADAIVLTKHAVDLGCGGVLMLPPFYYKAPSEEGLFRFFAEVIEEVGDDRLKVYLYHIPPSGPGRLLDSPDRPPDQGIPQDRRRPQGLLGRLEQHGGDPRHLSGLRGVSGLGDLPARRPAQGCGRLHLRHLQCQRRRHPQVYDNWQGPDADKLQADITALRKAIQAFPMIPALKALIAHYRQDPGWAKLRPPFVGLSAVEADKVIRTLAEAHGFKLDFAKAALSRRRPRAQGCFSTMEGEV